MSLAPTPSRALRRGVVGLLAAVLLAACSAEGSTTVDAPLTTVAVADRGEPVRLVGESLDGATIDLADLRGGVVVLNVWGSWCGPCRGEAPELAAASKSLAGAGVRFVGINIKDNADAARAFERRYGITYPSIFDTGGTTLLALRALPAVSTPTTLVLDARGRPAARFLGPVTADQLAAVVQDVLDEAAA